MEAVGVLVHVLVLAVLDEGPLDLVGGLVAQPNLHAVGNPADVHLGHRRALAGMNILHRDDDAELAVNLNDIAFSERAGDDFHGYLDVLPLNKGRTIAILSPIATYFLSCPRTRTCRKPRPPRPSGLPTSTPTGGRRSWRAA